MRPRAIRVLFFGCLLGGFGVPMMAIAIVALSGYKERTAGLGYYISGLGASAGLGLSALAVASLVAMACIASFHQWPLWLRRSVFLLLAVQAQVGIIPRLYGYLGLYGTEGMFGFLMSSIMPGENSLFVLSDLGTVVAMVVVYGPFMFLPTLAILMQVPNEVMFAVADLGGGRRRSFFILIRNYMKAPLMGYGLLFLVLVMFDFACSDLVGGGKVDALGKTLYRSVTLFQDLWTPSLIGLGLVILMMAYWLLEQRTDRGRER